MVGLWALAWQGAIRNWTFALLAMASVVAIPNLILRLSRYRSVFRDELAALDGPQLELTGIDTPLTVADRDRLDAALGIS